MNLDATIVRLVVVVLEIATAGFLIFGYIIAPTDVRKAPDNEILGKEQ